VIFLTESFRQKNNKRFSRESIIGLGEDSFRKNYYPELQEKIIDLEKINARNRAIIKTIPDIMLVSDLKGNISPFSLTSGSDAPFLIFLLRDDEVMSILRNTIENVISSRKMKSVRFSVVFEEKTHYMEARISISDINELLLMIRDSTEEILLENKLRDMVDRDSLTKMYNRRVFLEEMDRYDGLSDQSLALVILDIDGLKILNDTLGHQVGDQAIVAASELILSHFGSVGFVARLSGDEFGVILKNTTAQEIEEIKKALDAHSMLLNQSFEFINLSISFGYAVHYKGKLNVRLLFKEADNNMYQNKLFKSASARSGLVKTLMKALEARDYITEGHADRMEETAFLLGQAMGLNQNQLDKLKLLAKFHDIGKVGIPDKILNKPASLSDEEYQVMKTHTQIGKRIADESSELNDISDLIYYHHERWDGNGYPAGRKGEEIPIECRILSIVDTYDAMTNDRPYRRALPKEAALLEIKNNSGSQFDPNLTDVFIQLMHNNTAI